MHGLNRKHLISRLNSYKDKKRQTAASGGGKQKAAGQNLPEEWKQAGEYIFIREHTVPLPISDPFICPFLHPGPLDLNRIVFYDTETTGLSGGAGTRIFLTGFGIPSRGGIKVTQFFLADFPGEPEYLGIIAEQFRQDGVFVSFNGKGYDSHLLRSRFGMNGIQFQFPRQIDLLHPSRRLWKTLIGSCSLGNIESEILGVHREHDIPGYLVPDVYFSYLRTGDTGELLDVFHHNHQDVVSLALLLNTFGSIYEEPEAVKTDNVELGKLLLSLGEDKRGGALLLKEYQNGSMKAGRVLGFGHKRKGEKKEAAGIWKTLWNRDRDLLSAVELAKYLEHSVKDINGAAEVVEEIQDYIEKKDSSNLPRRFPGEIEKRRSRLLSKSLLQKD